MGTRRIPQDEMLFVVSNTSGQAVVVANRRVDSGQSADIPARYITGNINRCQAMSLLMTQGKIAVAMKFASGGYVSVPVPAPYMLSLQAPTAAPLGGNAVFATAARPAPADVPNGFEIYNDTTDIPNFNDGTAYLDAGGLPA